jgi:tetratricopeptide (TPR) repeat protein
MINKMKNIANLIKRVTVSLDNFVINILCVLGVIIEPAAVRKATHYEKIGNYLAAAQTLEEFCDKKNVIGIQKYNIINRRGWEEYLTIAAKNYQKAAKSLADVGKVGKIYKRLQAKAGDLFLQLEWPIEAAKALERADKYIESAKEYEKAADFINTWGVPQKFQNKVSFYEKSVELFLKAGNGREAARVLFWKLGDYTGTILTIQIKRNYREEAVKILVELREIKVAADWYEQAVEKNKHDWPIFIMAEHCHKAAQLFNQAGMLDKSKMMEDKAKQLGYEDIV